MSYQDVVDLLAERGITIDRSTVYRWVQKFGPELTKRAEKFLRRASVDWHVDETYVRVGGKWRYLWRAVDANNQMVDFRLTARRDAKAAKAFLNNAIERECPLARRQTRDPPRRVRRIQRPFPSISHVPISGTRRAGQRSQKAPAQ
nr:IS6 family transposase [Sulfitobacter dubius]